MIHDHSMLDETQDRRTADPAGRMLGTLLVQEEVITPEQLVAALHQQNTTRQLLGQVLIEAGHATSEDVARALAAQLRIPFLELDDDHSLNREEVRMVPVTIARRYGLIPFKRDGDDTLIVVMSDPTDIEALDMVRSLTQLEVHKAVSTPERIVALIDKFYQDDAHIERDLQDIIELESDEMGARSSEPSIDQEQLRVHANDAPVVRFVNLLLMEAIRDGASDIHFEPGERGVTVRFRVDGLLREVTPPPKSLYMAVVTRIKILSGMDIAERRLPLDGRFKCKVQNHVVDVRVSSLPEIHGEKIVLRVLDQSSIMTDMDKIGFDGDMLHRFQRILQRPHGIILLTGPTGSGKTTTLYSALKYLKSAERNIQTVEDPVEYQVPGINQMTILPKIGLDFARALRAILRQDPDIILIGEVRDLETAQIAMRASLTGHLVLSTLHTNDASSAFSRLQDIGIAPFLVAATVNLVISQRLVRAICEKCKESFAPEQDKLRNVRSFCHEAADWTFYRGAGCKACRNLGFKGRLSIFEFLEVTEQIRDMVQGCVADVDLRRKAIEQGMEPLAVNGFRRVQDGMTTIEEVMKVAPGENFDSEKVE